MTSYERYSLLNVLELAWLIAKDQRIWKDLKEQRVDNSSIGF